MKRSENRCGAVLVSPGAQNTVYFLVRDRLVRDEVFREGNTTCQDSRRTLLFQGFSGICGRYAMETVRFITTF